MKKAVAILMLLAFGLMTTGCSNNHPNEMGWGVAYSADERGKIIARNWDFEGKQIVDDIDSILLLRPAGHLTQWNLR